MARSEWVDGLLQGFTFSAMVASLGLIVYWVRSEHENPTQILPKTIKLEAELKMPEHTKTGKQWILGWEAAFQRAKDLVSASQEKEENKRVLDKLDDLWARLDALEKNAIHEMPTQVPDHKGQ